MEAAKKGTLVVPIVLAVLWIVASATLAGAGYEVVEVHIYFNIATQPIEELYKLLREILVSNIPRLVCHGHIFLSPKDYKRKGTPPARWVKVHLQGKTEEDIATLAFADCDIYLLAFQNNAGTWHTFKGYEHMFPNAVVLDALTESYSRLIKGGFKVLPTVPLGKLSALQAVTMLARYRHHQSPEQDVKTGLIRYMIMISEAMRFVPVREAFSGERWEMESYLSAEQANYVAYWGVLSYMVWRWDKNGKWEGPKKDQVEKEAGMKNADEALAILDLLRWPQAIRIPFDPF